MEKNPNRSVLEFRLTIKHLHGIEFTLDEIEDAFLVIKYEKDNS